MPIADALIKRRTYFIHVLCKSTTQISTKENRGASNVVLRNCCPFCPAFVEYVRYLTDGHCEWPQPSGTLRNTKDWLDGRPRSLASTCNASRRLGTKRPLPL